MYAMPRALSPLALLNPLVRDAAKPQLLQNVAKNYAQKRHVKEM